MTKVAGARSKGSMTSQVQDLLLRLIKDELKPGDQLPSEPELSVRYSVSRSTIREVLKLLEQDGLVYAVQGRGRFVSVLGAFSVERPITRYESMTDMLSSLGYDITTVVLDVREVGAPPRVAQLLDLNEGDPVIQLSRLRLNGDEPIVFNFNMVRRDALPGPLTYRDWGSSLTAALKAHGHVIETSAARISATNLPAEYSERYNLGGLDPWLAIEESCITRDGVRVLYACDYHRGDLIGFNVLRRG
ncbi:GntR family transcriptional regulator [Microbacterium jejuense]|uniref:GntR family transcriptional regulator n=1 Tax=Microbacterium jejuense TaxID=1263637 RepID=A0ABS7HK11_9MICO|nr:GntR family transcriptional regulator [Microbacterium jejuense]MBW9093065.1 GntR family transcriptional regulator [Microbacterium jejuense]